MKTSKIIGLRLCLPLTLALGFAADASALDCGRFDFPFCAKAAGQPTQFAGGFKPGVGFGGFGGGDCRKSITHTPVVFVHGNGDSAIGWDAPGPARAGQPAQPSVYAQLKAAGYNDCELFGVTYLSRAERPLADTGKNFHRPEKYKVIWRFIKAVKAYTGSSRVDIVGHSMGVSMTLAALDYYGERGEAAWPSVRRFVNIAGGIRGLNSCVPAFATVAACQAEHSGPAPAFYQFGFFPDMGWTLVPNRWTAVQGEHSLRQAARRHPEVAFYTILAGAQDDIHCPGMLLLFQPVDCHRGPMFAAADNVVAQLDIGAEPASTAPTWAAKVSADIATQFPHDLGGVGHFGARNYAGPIIRQMLTTDCRGAACAGGYAGAVTAVAP